MRRLTVPLGAALTLALSGCWISEQPLMPDAAKDMPQLADRYLERNSDGTDAGLALVEPLDGEIRLTLEHGTESKQVYWLRFDWLFDNWYLVQATPEGEDNRNKMSFFRLLRRQEAQWLEFDPECGDDLAQLAGVERSGGDCMFTDYASVVAAATSEARKIDESDGAAGEFSGSYVPDIPSR
ncbi:MAG: hypothetical protein R3E09_18915 [Novosphingobium sp.]